MNKKAQNSASYAGGFVIAIAVLLFLYVLFLPPEQRQELLSENQTQTQEQNETITEQSVLLLENPGRIVPKTITQKYSEGHSLGEVRIYTLTEAVTIKRINPFYISSSIFSEKKKQVNFRIKDLENTKNLILSFNVNSHKGRLIIKLNGEEIFNNEIKTQNPEPVLLDEDLIQEENIIEFSVSKPSLFSKNFYDLSNIRIIGYKTDTSHKKSVLTFQVSSSEYQTLESLRLKYFIDCYSKETGKLSIKINGFSLGSFTPECQSVRVIEFPAHYLIEGQNSISFETEEGDYLIYQIRIEPVFKEISHPTYYFELTSEQYKEIMNETKNLVLTMNFPDDSQKEAKIYINGYVIGLTTRDLSFETTIDKEYLFEHLNSLKIEPDKTIEITELKLEIKEP